MFGRNLQYKIVQQTIDEEGRFVILELEMCQQKIVLATHYAPNLDDPTFFLTYFGAIEKMQNPNIIIGGDFNTVLDVIKDRAGTSDYNHDKALKIITTFMQENDLCDIWRVRNPDLTQYSWHRKNTKLFSRIDFFLISNALTQNVLNIKMLPGVVSDHDILKLVFVPKIQKRGKGFWKFNSSLLQDQKHNQKVEQAFQDAVFRYENENPALKWEMIKLEMIQASTSYSKLKAKEKNLKLNELHQRLDRLSTLLHIAPDGSEDSLEQSIAELNSQIQNILNAKYKSLTFKNKVK